MMNKEGDIIIKMWHFYTIILLTVSNSIIHGS